MMKKFLASETETDGTYALTLELSAWAAMGRLAQVRVIISINGMIFLNFFIRLV